MAIATAVQEYLEQESVGYEVLTHVPTWDSMHTAAAAHIPCHQLAKAVVLEDDRGYLLAVIPADRRLNLRSVDQELDRELALTDEMALAEIFSDCEPGSVPPLGRAYAIDSIVDPSLIDSPNVYFEGGDHLSLVHVSGNDFRKLMAGSQQRSISRGYDGAPGSPS